MTHIEDGMLLRYIDSQSLTGEGDVVRDHLASCAACAARLRQVRDRLALVGNALRQTDVVARRTAPGRLRWVPYAAAAALLGLMVGVAPVRGWIVDGLGTVWSAVRGSPDGVSPSMGAAATQDPLSATISFVPGGDVFVLQIADRQASGSLTVEIAETATASATVVGDAAAGNLVVLPAGLRIENTAGSTDRYIVRLPSTLRRVLIMVGTESPVALDFSRAERRWEIPLARAEVSH